MRGLKLLSTWKALSFDDSIGLAVVLSRAQFHRWVEDKNEKKNEWQMMNWSLQILLLLLLLLLLPRVPRLLKHLQLQAKTDGAFFMKPQMGAVLVLPSTVLLPYWTIEKNWCGFLIKLYTVLQCCWVLLLFKRSAFQFFLLLFFQPLRNPFAPSTLRFNNTQQKQRQNSKAVVQKRKIYSHISSLICALNATTTTTTTTNTTTTALI